MVTLESARTVVAARPREEQGAPVCSLNAPPSNEILEQDRAREVDAGKGIWAWLWVEENLSAKNKPPQHQKLQHADAAKPPSSRDRNASDRAAVVVVTPPPLPPRLDESPQPSRAARAHPSTPQPSTPQPSGIEQHGYDGNVIDLALQIDAAKSRQSASAKSVTSLKRPKGEMRSPTNWSKGQQHVVPSQSDPRSEVARTEYECS